MNESGRRRFLRGSVAAAGAVVSGVVKPLRASDGGQPSSRGFLDAVVRGDLAAVRQALSKEADLLRARDVDGRSAFGLALLHHHPDVASLLRERGHSPDLHESALALDWARFESLAADEPVAVNQDHPVGGTAMYAAAVGGAGTEIWRVYRVGGQPNAAPRGRRGYTPVRAALEHPDLALAELTVATLIGNGASPEGPQRGGSSPLHVAARRGSLDVVELLLRKGAGVEARDEHGRTPLDLAEEARHGEVVQLLRHHRDVPRDHDSSRTAYDVEGRRYAAPDLGTFEVSALINVVGHAHRNLDVIRETVDRRPELAHAQATTTERAIEAGAHMGRTDIVDYLLGHGVPYAIPTAVVRNDLERVRALLQEDPARVNERGAHDFPLFWYPVIGKGLIDMAELLLAFGARVEQQHWLGTTALHYAAIGGQVEMAAWLLDKGADPNRVGRKFGAEGHTPTELARARGHETVVQLLKDRGARG